MSALNWLREHAKEISEETFDVEGAPYTAKSFAFEGHVPMRMIHQLRKQLAQVIKTDDVHEVLFVGGPNRSDATKCQFYRTEYQAS